LPKELYPVDWTGSFHVERNAKVHIELDELAKKENGNQHFAVHLELEHLAERFANCDPSRSIYSYKFCKSTNSTSAINDQTV